MEPIKIGFMGGCLNNQAGISRKDLYYSIVSARLSSNQTEHQISLCSYHSYSQLLDQTKKFIEKKKPELLYLFIRPFPLMPLQKPWVKYDTADHKVTYTLHPALFSRQMVWKEELTKHQVIREFEYVKKSVFSFRDLNLLTGLVLGLHFWARNYLTDQLDSVKEICSAHEIKLVIISPPQNPESLIANLICKWTANYLEQFYKRGQIDYINIYSFSLSCFEQDKIHFNSQGHKKLGELIYHHSLALLQKGRTCETAVQGHRPITRAHR